MRTMKWLVFVVGAVLSWGAYGALLHQGQTQLANPLKALLCVGSAYPFRRYGKNGVELSELMPNIGGIVDEIAIIREFMPKQMSGDEAKAAIKVKYAAYGSDFLLGFSVDNYFANCKKAP